MTKVGNVSGANKQFVGNVGLYYAAYMLSWLGWNVSATSRNAKGPDLIINSSDGKQMKSVQVKALSKRADISLGKSGELAADFMVICEGVMSMESVPTCYVLTRKEVAKLSGSDASGWWLQAKDFMAAKYLDNWRAIGKPSVS